MQNPQQTATQRSTKNVIRLAIWTFAWVGSLALAAFGSGTLWDSEVISWIAVGVNVGLGAGWIVAHARFIRGADDLQRKILLDAIALSLGVGLVVGFAYSAANKAGLVAVDSEIAFLTVLMSLVYIVSIAVGNLRFR